MKNGINKSNCKNETTTVMVSQNATLPGGMFLGGEAVESLPGNGFHGGEAVQSLPGNGFHGGEAVESLPGNGFHGGEAEESAPEKKERTMEEVMELLPRYSMH